MIEKWKVYYESNLPKTHGKYVKWEVSNLGRVKRNGKLYKPKMKKGYLQAGRFYIHRMVAECFIPNPENKPCVDHINSDCHDNRVINLQWSTPKENSNNPITRKRMSKSMNKPETRKLLSESMKGKNKDKHRVYHDDGTWHMEY